MLIDSLEILKFEYHTRVIYLYYIFSVMQKKGSITAPQLSDALTV